MFSRAGYGLEMKLAMLYLLNKSTVRLNADQLIECMSVNDIMNYFDAVNSLSELSESMLVYEHEDTDPKSYTLSVQGKNTLGEFKTQIPSSVREKIDLYIKENSLALRRENEHTANLYSLPDGKFLASLKARDDDTSELEIAFTVESREIGEHICQNWREKAGDVYKYIIEQLVV